MLLSIKLVVDLKIQDCKLITTGVPQKNNTIAGGPGYPDVRRWGEGEGEEFLITSFKLNLFVNRFNSYGDRIRRQNPIKGTLACKMSSCKIWSKSQILNLDLGKKTLFLL